MKPDLFHFSHALWLWGLLAIPAVLAVYGLLRRQARRLRALERFADKHLLPHLIKNSTGEGAAWKLPWLIWAFAWACGMVAMAGPQWRYTDTEVFKANRDVVIVLDLSSTMNATDSKPSRLARRARRNWRFSEYESWPYHRAGGLCRYAAYGGSADRRCAHDQKTVAVD